MNNSSEPTHAPVPLSKIIPNQELCADIYLLINEKYLKYKNAGEQIGKQRYDEFLNKDLKEVYILIGDIPSFIEWMKTSKEDSINELVAEVGEENRELVETREEIKETVYEVFADREINSAVVEHLQNVTENFINKAKQMKESSSILAKLVKHNRSLADHSVNVANLSIYLAMSLGHGHQLVLENIYLGALLHDYGKAKIPSKVLDNPSGSLYQQAIEFHPIKGAKSARSIPSIKDPVAVIIEQHHEQYNGKGFPKGLAGKDIYELSQIVALANHYDNTCDENANMSESQKVRAAIKKIEYDRGKMFNPDILDRAVDALKLAFGNYKR
ncbi:HD-GYP domain-containing protein [Halobacteriovorax sp.]|uniref:HD-GYP domain-containing protein n=1 Tax=Halobacteriovorax sp. TaxID=2020862 RepID=UPI0035689FFD